MYIQVELSEGKWSDGSHLHEMSDGNMFVSTGRHVFSHPKSLDSTQECGTARKIDMSSLVRMNPARGFDLREQNY